MIRIAFRRCLNHSSRFQRRFLATVVDESPSGIAPKPSDELSGELRTFRTQEGALRGHLEIPVKKNHGLYAFFRRVPDEDSLDKYKYVSYEAYHDRIHGSGRAWQASELRRKSFRDLHILWYLCRRELNLLATQKGEIGRLNRFINVNQTPIGLRARMCRKTCARIKYVLNERRLAFDEATAQIRWQHRPGHKDPAKDPFKVELERQTRRKAVRTRRQKLYEEQKQKIAQGIFALDRPRLVMNAMSEKEKNLRLFRLKDIKSMHPQLRKRPMLMLRWGPRKGWPKPIRYRSDSPVS